MRAAVYLILLVGGLSSALATPNSTLLERRNAAIKNSQTIQVPGDDPATRDVFFELYRLQQLPGGNPLLSSLEEMGIRPTEADKLKAALLRPEPPYSPEQLRRMAVLLRVENTLQREPDKRNLYRQFDAIRKQMLDSLSAQGFDRLAALGRKLQSTEAALHLRRRELLREMARRDLKGIVQYRADYAKYRIHFPIGLRTALEQAAKKSGLKKYDLRIEPDEKSFTLPLAEAAQVLKGPGGLELPMDPLIAIAARARDLNRALRGDLASRDDAADLLDDANQRLRAGGPLVPSINPLRSPPAVSGNPGYFFEREAPGKSPAAGNQGPNACFDDSENTVNKDPAELGADAISHFSQTKGAPETSFRIVVNSKSLDAKGKEGNCLASIADTGPELTAAPGRPPGWKRAVLLGVSHCFPDDVTQIRIAGIGTIPASQLVVHKMPGKADSAAVSFDLPPELASRMQLPAIRSRFVKVPAPSDAAAENLFQQTVKTDVNFSRYGGNSLIGKTFAVEGDISGNFVGLNFLHWANQGEGIDPGTSGAAVVGPGNTYLGSVSYKCLSSDFQGGVGAMASGKKVFKFLHDLIQPAGTALTEYTPNDPVLIAHAPRERMPAATDGAHGTNL